MRTGRPIRAYGTMRGWWATTVRVLSLVLAVALVLPGTVHSTEAHDARSHELSMSAAAGGVPSSHSDACPGCHANCGCHQALTMDGTTSSMPSRVAGRASYETAVAVVGSVSPDRLPRPPRA